MTKEGASLGSLRNRRSQNRFSYVQRQTHKTHRPFSKSLGTKFFPKALSEISSSPLHYITLRTMYIHAMRTTNGCPQRWHVVSDDEPRSHFGGLPRATFLLDQTKTNSRANFLGLSSLVGSSPCLMWCSRNYSHRASTHRGDAGALTRGWQRRTRCPQMRLPRQRVEAVAPVLAAAPTLARLSSAAWTLSWLGNRCRPRKPWRDLPRARRSSRPGRRRTARDYLRTTKHTCECKGLPRDTR